MIAEKVCAITAPPKTYSDWLDCFDVLQHKKRVTKTELQFLSMGECVASAASVEYLETQLIQTINAMIRLYIQAFQKELAFHTMYREYENIYQLFVNLANRLNSCMFFVHLDFMSETFKNELRSSVVSEIDKFWKAMVDSMYRQCIEQGDLLLEDELYMIRRIKLFR